MTPTPHAELERLLAKVQEGGRRLPWELWTSCSYRRIKTAAVPGDREDGKDVMSGYRCDDGAVDLSMPEDQLFALVAAVNSLPSLLAEIRGLREAVKGILGSGKAGTWSSAVEPLIARFEVSANFGGDAVHNPEGSRAIAELLRTMATRLDGAVIKARAALANEGPLPVEDNSNV